MYRNRKITLYRANCLNCMVIVHFSSKIFKDEFLKFFFAGRAPCRISERISCAGRAPRPTSEKRSYWTVSRISFIMLILKRTCDIFYITGYISYALLRVQAFLCMGAGYPADIR